MTYYTQLSLTWNDGDHVAGTLKVDQVVAAAQKFVTENKWSEDCLEDLRRSCETVCLGNVGFNRAMSLGVIELVRSISEQISDVTFYAKGSGEEFWDIWIREYRAGKIIVEFGPFEVCAEPIPEELIAQAKAAAAIHQKQQKPASNWLSALFRK